MAMRLSDDNDDAVSSKIAYQTVNVRGEVPYSSGWFPNDGRVAVLVLFDLGIIIIIVGVSRRHSVAYDGDEAPADRPFSGKRGVMSASCWILRHLRTDVSAQAGVGNIPILHSKLSKCR